ncbi:MAG: pyruvate kinase alpha/beta domain-containing protein [Dehalococcoidia bacterium]
MQEQITYFEKEGEANTSRLLSLVKERAQSRGIEKVVLASTRGETAKAAVESFAGAGIELVIVSWQFGFADEHPFPQALVDEIRSKGHRVHFGTMLFHTDRLYGVKTPEVMGNLLRTFGQGMKVCTEITMMACDGGHVKAGEKVIAVAGTASGADTAIVTTASPSTRMPALRIHEIICKPLL